MKHIQIEATKKSPGIDINPVTRVASFTGRSIHSDAFIFYEDIIEWFKGVEGRFEDFTVEFCFDHINTVTNKCLLQILLIIKKAIEKGGKIVVIWGYDEDDDDMKETGEELEMLSELKFEFRTL